MMNVNDRCTRCGKRLSAEESYAAELMPPALCRRCSTRELEHLKKVLGLAGIRRLSRGLRAVR